jgi:hypothetical protein
MGQTFELQPGTTRVNGERKAMAVANPSNDEFITDYRDELTDMRSRLTGLADEDPADVLATLSGVAGRLSEIRANLYRSSSQRAQTLRVQEVDPLRDDLELQFKIHSRRIALLEWELRMSGGGI